MLSTFETAAQTGQRPRKSPAQRGFSGVRVWTGVTGKGVCRVLPRTGEHRQADNEGGLN